MALAGLFLGLALSTRWTSLWATGFLGLVLLVRARPPLVRAARARPRGDDLRRASRSRLYVLSYVPWMRQADPWHTRLTRAARSTRARSGATTRTCAPSIPTSAPGTPGRGCTARPGTTSTRPRTTPAMVRGIVALGNPWLWWASVPVTVWALVTGVRARDPRRLFSGLGFACLYLPWGISPRTLNYGHYLFEAIPYACLSLGHPARPVLGHARRELARGVPGASSSSRSSSSFRSWPRSPCPRPGTTTTSTACGRGRGSRPGSRRARYRLGREAFSRWRSSPTRSPRSSGRSSQKLKDPVRLAGLLAGPRRPGVRAGEAPRRGAGRPRAPDHRRVVQLRARHREGRGAEASSASPPSPSWAPTKDYGIRMYGLPSGLRVRDAGGRDPRRLERRQRA